MKKILLFFALVTTAVYSMAMENIAPEKVPKQYVDFSKKAIQSINSGDGKFFDQSFDLDDFMKRMMRGYKLSPKNAAGFKKGFSRGFTLGTTLCQKKAYYTFLGFQKDKNDLYLVLRLTFPNGSVNYHKILLIMRNGKPGIVDIYAFSGGEFLSKTGGRAALQMLGLQHGKKTKTFEILAKFAKAFRNQNYDTALKLYKTLPEKYRKDKSFLLMYYGAACSKGIDSKEFKDAVMNFEKYHSNNPSLDLLILDSLFIGKKYDALLKRIERIEKNLGYKDAFLELCRGNAAFFQGKTNKAEKLYTKSIQLDSLCQNSYWGLIAVYLKQKQWSKVCSQLNTFKKVFNMQIADLSTIPDYAEFVKTKEYKAWIKKQNAAAKS